MHNGIGASEGIIVGKVYVIQKADITFAEISRLSNTEEMARYNETVEAFIKDTTKLVESLKEDVGEEEANILESHIMMVNDPEITKAVADLIENGVTAEYALSNAFDTFADLFASLEDELMSQRALDLKDIKSRLLEILTGNISTGIDNIKEDCVIICHDLTPSDTGRMDKSKVKGIVTEVGGMTSHTAIISRAMGIPTVLSVDNITQLTESGDIIAVNGNTGEVIVNPSEAEIAEYSALIEEFAEYKKELEQYKTKESITLDNHHVEICANIGGLDDLESAIKNTAEGIGLFRTEFLFMDRQNPPDEDDQFEVYKNVAETLEGKSVIIRTLDIGGDKDIPYLNLEKEENPFLGYRAIRICLDDKDMFKVQLRALLRASYYGNIKIMLPMIATMTELRDAKALFDESKEDLRKQQIPFDENIQIGIMIETPAACMIADLLAKECDFFSIGTNDLTQYTMAVDRGNKRVQYLYSTFDPAVIRSIYKIIKAGKDAGIMVGMCGEGAGDVNMIPFLLAAGLDEFSMTATSVLRARKSVCSLSKKDLESHIETILNLETEKEVHKYLSGLAM